MRRLRRLAKLSQKPIRADSGSGYERRTDTDLANANALRILDNFASYMALTLDADMLDEMETLFAAYLEKRA